MKKIFFYLLSLLSIICMLLGFFLKKSNIMGFGFYLHFVDATYISLEEYKNSKKITVKTIYYPLILLIFTIMVIYQATLS